MTPNETIVAFIKRQPEQTRDSICSGLVMISGKMDWSSADEAAQVAYDLIDAPGTFSKVMSAASVIGVLDYFFAFPPPAPEAVDEAAGRAQSPLLAQIAQRMELTNAFFERASKEWNALRQGDLSFEALRRFEAILRK